MTLEQVAARGLVLLGCGKMGSAMLAGWLQSGVSAASVWVQDPAPSDWVMGTGVQVNTPLPESPGLVLVAVKPQMMDQVLPAFARMGGGATLFVSIAAGTSLDYFQTVLGAGTPVIRTMPNTPAAIGQGITALVGNDHVTADDLDLTEALMSALGATVRLDDEVQMHAVTAISGSGPAYVFHMIESMAAAGEALGLDAALAQRLAMATVSGAGALAQASDLPVEVLRRNVTSPNGTTEAGLGVLMDEVGGLRPLIRATAAAADARSRELAGG